ncbi:MULTISPECIES: cupin domain-containing protein [Myroides]|uniref:Cupin domain-containing protein n=1 Tax=Myroides albus TaxID=2562892 RepID=A0A6I3LU46_9FLAO|nr:MULTISPECIES: cupin domain-containing protein [Myroides]MTG99495.1 cupin domain-containing protein [Myroides albus]MVX34739.1 cupin domain-containing protein [Myroides sp. LoEW2-1]UVD78570.1 cupin domain-containing protein [Myroides albus]
MDKANILENLTYGDSKPAIAILIDNAATKEIRIAFKSGQEMKEHKTKFPIVVHIIKGNIDFGVNSERYNLKEGDIITLEPNVPHDLLAKADSIVRLTLNKSDTISRVEKVINS